MIELTLFGEAPADPPEPQPVAEPGRPVWAQVRTSARCTICVLALVETKGSAPPSRTARYRRRIGRAELLLCFEHAQEQRLADGMPLLRGPRP